MSKNIRYTSELVKSILETDSKARNSDNYLLSQVYARIGKERGIDIANMPVLVFFNKISELNLPSPETIRRTRQKLQADYPRLCASENVAAGRTENEQIYKNYAVSRR